MTAQVTRPAPDFTADAVFDGEVQLLRLSDYRGKYVILFFYPLDFTLVCPTELIAFSDDRTEFTKRNAELIGVSIDSPYTHLAWTQTPRQAGGVGNLGFPIVSDLSKSIARDYGVLLEEAGIALRALFLIDKEGIIRHALINDLPLGRSVGEAIRVLDAWQHFEQVGEVCPANWTLGKEGLKSAPEGSKEYFEKVG
jgi:peroxiredoxin (alkyl hydroperoxide reductase subunit C)